MGINNFLNLLGGLALFLYGMNVMSKALERLAGHQLRALLSKMTSNPFKGFLLGFAVTAIVQSSSATTVMVVGFVNSGVMTLYQSVGIIIGANIGAAIMPFILSLSGVGGANFSVTTLITAGCAVIGVLLYIFIKKSNTQRNLGHFLLGFGVLMFGMTTMSGSVSSLSSNETFTGLLTLFKNPFMGILIGLVVTIAIQSSSASIGILQALTATGGIINGMAIPILMGQNTGTCISAMIASVGANKSAKRASFVHLTFNVISMVLFGGIYIVFYYLLKSGAIVNETITNFLDGTSNTLSIAVINICYKIVSVLTLIWFPNMFVKIANKLIPEDNKQDEIEMLDERLFKTPSVAVKRADDITCTMAATSFESIKMAIRVFENYDTKAIDEIKKLEDDVDVYEDKLGSYLVKLSTERMTPENAQDVTKMLHVLSDIERISDHAVSLAASATEMRDKKLSFSDKAKDEFIIMCNALDEILDLTAQAFIFGDLKAASHVEPLEQVIDNLREEIKKNHIARLQNSECTIEHGFILSDILTILSRVSDHCSNIAGCVIELKHNSLDMHEYLAGVKRDDEDFDAYYAMYMQKYSLG